MKAENYTTTNLSTFLIRVGTVLRYFMNTIYRKIVQKYAHTFTLIH